MNCSTFAPTAVCNPIAEVAAESGKPSGEQAACPICRVGRGPMEIYSIGFTQKSAGEFFGALKAHGIERLLDVRLNNTSQLAGFAKHSDLPYFLREICGAAYEHEPLLAPTQEILDAFKKHKGSWDAYTEAYLALIRARESRIRSLQRELPKENRPAMQRANCGALPSPARARVFAEALERCSYFPSLDLSFRRGQAS